MTKRPLILITNDDGYDSPGVHASAEALQGLGELLVVAPASQQTAMGQAHFTGPQDGVVMRWDRKVGGELCAWYAVTGTPANAVIHAVAELADRLPDLCVSGINHGENLGSGLGISGTVGAAMQASLFGIPAIAMSLEADIAHWRTNQEMDWAVAQSLTRRLAEQVLRDGLPPEVRVINANVPSDATPDTEIRKTFQSRQWYVHPLPTTGDRVLTEAHTIPMGVSIDRETLEPGSDTYAFVVDRVISISALGNHTVETEWVPAS